MHGWAMQATPWATQFHTQKYSTVVVLYIARTHFFYRPKTKNTRYHTIADTDGLRLSPLTTPY